MKIASTDCLSYRERQDNVQNFGYQEMMSGRTFTGWHPVLQHAGQIIDVLLIFLQCGLYRHSTRLDSFLIFGLYRIFVIIFATGVLFVLCTAYISLPFEQNNNASALWSLK